MICTGKGKTRVVFVCWEQHIPGMKRSTGTLSVYCGDVYHEHQRTQITYLQLWKLLTGGAFLENYFLVLLKGQ